MLSQEILDLYKKSRLMTYRAMFGRIREKTGSLSATEAYAVDVIYLLGSPTITQLAETLGISQPNAKTVHSLPGIKVTTGAEAFQRMSTVAVQQVGRAAGNMKYQYPAVKQFITGGCKQRCGNVSFLMR